jgi:ABC-2 type transport system ATP-binding protein
MVSSMPSIEAIRLSKEYDSFTALNSLNLRIEGSKCIGFLGPNGAGKTTTLKIFTDLIHRSSGRALINGIDVHSDKKKALAAVAALVETPEIYPTLTPREALMIIAKHRGVPVEIRNKKIGEALHEVHMEDWENKKVGQFSKGMKQRVNIASTLLSDPEIILFDEPTSGLDPRGMSEVREMVKDLKKRKRLIFMSSHLLSEVMDVCDEAALIDHGKLLVYDTIQNLTRRFSGSGSVLEVGFASPRLDSEVIDKIRNIHGVSSIEMLDDRDLRLKFVGNAETQAEILSELVALRLGVNSYKASSSALEDVYLNLIKETV